MVDFNKPPVIGISGSSADSASVRAMMRQIQETGAIPMFLGRHTDRNAAADIAKIDALIVLGNNSDINPAKYGEAKDSHTKNEDDTPEGKARADYEEAIIRSAMEMKMPVLGVCGGMQRINILCGGSLHQHIPDLIGHNEHAQQDYQIGPYIPVQPVILAKNTGLSDIARDISMVYTPGHEVQGPSVIMENSMHHQAVNLVGEGLRPAAFSDDHIKLPDGRDTLLIEAIEADPNGPFKNQFLMGVQWHPEFGASALGERIASHFADAAQEYAKANNRSHSLEETLQESMKSALVPSTLAPRRGSITDRILSARRTQDPTAGLAI